MYLFIILRGFPLRHWMLCKAALNYHQTRSAAAAYWSIKYLIYQQTEWTFVLSQSCLPVFWMKFIASVSARGMCALHRDQAADSQVKGQGCSQLCRQKRHTNKPKDAQTHAHTEDHNTKITAHLLHLRASFSWPDSSCGFARNRLTPSCSVVLALLTATDVLVMFTRRRIFWCSLFFFQMVFFLFVWLFVKLSFL